MTAETLFLGQRPEMMPEAEWIAALRLQWRNQCSGEVSRGVFYVMREFFQERGRCGAGRLCPRGRQTRNRGRRMAAKQADPATRGRGWTPAWPKM